TARSEAYAFRLLDLQGGNVTPLTLGSSVSASVGAYAAVAYTFNGTGGQRLYFNGTTTTGTVRWYLWSGGGRHEVASGTLSSDSGPFTLTQAGPYYLILSDDDGDTDSYSFRLLDVAAQPALAVGATASATLTVDQADLYRIQGSKGQRLFFDWPDSTNG